MPPPHMTTITAAVTVTTEECDFGAIATDAGHFDDGQHISTAAAPLLPPHDDDVLFEIFRKYSQFGQGRVVAKAHPASSAASNSTSSLLLPTAHQPKLQIALLDGARFAKLAREAGLVNGSTITSTDVDIIFNRVRDKCERKISFRQFKMALAMIGEKMFPASQQAFTRRTSYPRDNSASSAASNCAAMLHSDSAKHVYSIVCRLEGPGLSTGTTIPETSKLVDHLMQPCNAGSANRRRSLGVSGSSDRPLPSLEDPTLSAFATSDSLSRRQPGSRLLP